MINKENHSLGVLLRMQKVNLSLLVLITVILELVLSQFLCLKIFAMLLIWETLELCCLGIELLINFLDKRLKKN